MTIRSSLAVDSTFRFDVRFAIEMKFDKEYEEMVQVIKDEFERFKPEDLSPETITKLLNEILKYFKILKEATSNGLECDGFNQEAIIVASQIMEDKASVLTSNAFMKAHEAMQGMIMRAMAIFNINYETWWHGKWSEPPAHRDDPIPQFDQYSEARFILSDSLPDYLDERSWLTNDGDVKIALNLPAAKDIKYKAKMVQPCGDTISGKRKITKYRSVSEWVENTRTFSLESPEVAEMKSLSIDQKQ